MISSCINMNSISKTLTFKSSETFFPVLAAKLRNLFWWKIFYLVSLLSYDLKEDKMNFILVLCISAILCSAIARKRLFSAKFSLKFDFFCHLNHIYLNFYFELERQRVLLWVFSSITIYISLIVDRLSIKIVLIFFFCNRNESLFFHS